MCPHWAAVAEQEGLDEIATTFPAVASVEEGTVFKRDREVFWKCQNCGYIALAAEAPAQCPMWGHPQGWYEMREVLE
jgi:rubrerythrin